MKTRKNRNSSSAVEATNVVAPSLSAPVIGTLHQWRDLPPNDRHTVMLLNDRMRQETSVNQIHEFFRTGRGREFPSWVREDFLNRESPGVVLEQAGNAANASPEAPPAQEPPAPARRPRRRKSPSAASLSALTLLVRSATFRGAKTYNKIHRKWTRIAALTGIRVFGKGRLLSTLDLIVWMGAVQLARAKEANPRVRLTFTALLKATGRPDGAKSRVLLGKSLEPIGQFKIRLNTTWGGRPTKYEGPLLSGVHLSPAKAGKRSDFQWSVSAALLTLFEAGETYLKVSDLRLLRQRPLCLWLWAFYRSHGKAHAMFVETVQGLSGFDGPTYEFRRLLKEGLEFLKQQKLIRFWNVDEKSDKVTVVRQGPTLGNDA
jgi:hypothetical protein